MVKKLKSENNNEWTSLPEHTSEDLSSNNKKDKTETDNQWTTTAKNNLGDK